MARWELGACSPSCRNRDANLSAAQNRAAAAARYVQNRRYTLVVSPDNRSRLAISGAIRAARIEARQLRGKAYRARVLDPRRLTREDLRFAATYWVGDVISCPLPSVYEPSYREFVVGDRVQFTKALRARRCETRRRRARLRRQIGRYQGMTI